MVKNLMNCDRISNILRYNEQSHKIHHFVKSKKIHPHWLSSNLINFK